MEWIGSGKAVKKDKRMSCEQKHKEKTEMRNPIIIFIRRNPVDISMINVTH